jgi:putative transposase
VSQKYEFIDAQCADASTGAADNAAAIVQMCRWLGVSKSGFYEWRPRPESATAKRQERPKLLIKKIFDDSDSTYGYRRIARQLARQGVAAGAELVRKLMRVLGLVPCQPRPRRPSTTQQGTAGPIPDLINRDFSAAAPGGKMVGDITYIPTWEGWVYLASVIDCATRKCAGWALGDNYKTPLITRAIERAVRNLDLPPAAVFHSDRGSEGGFNRSSQHLDSGGVDGQASGLDDGVDGAVADEVAGRAGTSAGGRARVLV